MKENRLIDCYLDFRYVSKENSGLCLIDSNKPIYGDFHGLPGLSPTGAVVSPSSSSAQSLPGETGPKGVKKDSAMAPGAMELLRKRA